MPTQKQILQDHLHDSISKKSAKRLKNPLAAHKAKPVLRKENQAAKSSWQKAVKKAARKALTVQKSVYPFFVPYP